MNRDTMLVELQGVLNASATFADWSEATLLGFLAEGQDKFCEKTGYFVDVSSYSVTLQTGVAVYAIPDRIIKVLNIWYGAKRLSKIRTDEEYCSWGDWLETMPTGIPTAWRTDQETGVINLYPTPTIEENGVVLPLQVWRYSLYDLAGVLPIPLGGSVAADADPEIPSRFHRACIEWAAFKAFSFHDAETQDQVKAKDHYDNFMLYVKDGILAMQRYHGHEVRVGTSPAYRT